MFNFSQLAFPVVQAPMAGGINNPKFAAAVANSGGVGSFGFSYSSPQKISEDLLATKHLTQGPINANFFVFREVELPDAGVQSNAVSALQKLSLGDECNICVPSAPFYPALEDQLRPIWTHRPQILTFHFGIPPQGCIEHAHALGIAVGITATSLGEAIEIQKAGVDFVVAQGIEAGGHRGIFDQSTQDDSLSTIDLTQMITQNCSLPVVAAGAIMTGLDIRNVLLAGAAAAQLGTAFLCCDEAGSTLAHKDYLLNKQHRGTVLTKAFSGRMARGIRNEFIDKLESCQVLPFPIQNTMTASLRQLAVKTNNGEFQSLWAGSAYSKIRKCSTTDLMKILMEEYSAAGGVNLSTTLLVLGYLIAVQVNV